MKTRRHLTLLLLAAGLLACNSASSPSEPNANARGGDGDGDGDVQYDGQGVAVDVAVAGSAQALAFDVLKQRADQAQHLDEAGALASYPVEYLTALSYDPSASAGLDTIQGSALALSDGELEKLGEQGFVVSTRREFPTFLRGLAEIYSEHLPLYVSADAILETVHSSYDAILLRVEQAVLIPTLDTLLGNMHERIASSDAQASVKADADLYIAVARSLLAGHMVDPMAGGDASAVQHLYREALTATGLINVKLFGVTRMEDFSQFKPRGHYTCLLYTSPSPRD